MAVICLDPGHGGADPGAVRAGLAEKDITLAVALAARRALVPRHCLILTRETDRTLTLAERRRIAEEAGSDLFVSIHVNAAAGPQAQGVEAIVRERADAASLALAAAILEAIAARWPTRRSRGIKERTLAVLRQSRPACLVECFFLSHPDERALLRRPQTRAALGEAIGEGCEVFLQPPAMARRPAAAAEGTGRTAPPAARSRRPRAPRRG
jgi:N-acetylmuramoyl-L-alanine amidase